MIAVPMDLSESYIATPEAVGVIRTAVGAYATAAGFRAEQLDDVRLAVSEAVTNVVIHAYRGAPGQVYVTARAFGDELWVLIADDGCGYNTPPTHPGLGWGLAVITDSADEFTLADRADGGTEARMRFVRATPDGVRPADR